MSVEIVLVGGPADGRTFMPGGDVPPMLWRVSIEQSVALFSADLDLDFAPMPVADYEPLFENGWPSRTDSGVYRYRYRGTPPPVHPPQARSSPTLDELAEMTRDPRPSSYPDSRSHLLACRTRYSLRRDMRLTSEERAAVDVVTLSHVREALADRRHNT